MQAAHFLASDGTKTCAFNKDVLSDAKGPLLEVRDGNVYTVGARLPTYTFEADGVFHGSSASGELIVVASDDQQAASPLRKAIIAALLSGVCR